ncbi:uncharacterized protein DUF4352 [Actinomadura pelletieri DSM 43383]|uniref:Uncharacterized protein DUF4352 n=1 Tax=Actinomadura pelletieri DSM 43383 TaxID=1120940 RepID=A0A495QZL3_9ACTN|nr:DUF4352 domain-containing protein [Actinomadura pelletieri]RKS79488.1 uncharacterized protein DUF4352 [Actinomadura pelletieri DSM 43383]
MRKIIIGLVAVAVLTAGCELEQEPVAVQSEGSGKPEGAGGGTTKAKTFPIKLTAKRARAKRSVLSDGGPLSCVKVTVTNQTKKQLEVNPLYFSLTDTDNTKHDSGSALGDYEDQIPTTSLAPKEKATGLVCAKGKFQPKIVAMTNPLFAEAARAKVAS